MPFKDPQKRAEYNAEYQRKWQAENREKSREYTRKWQAANPEKRREYEREHPRTRSAEYKAKQADYRRAWRESHVDAVREYGRRHEAKRKRDPVRKAIRNSQRNVRYAALKASNPEILLRRSREHYQRYKATQYATKLKKQYGLTVADYDAMLAAQGGGCAVCGEKKTGMRHQKKFHVDHDHATGKVRGILCATCNLTIGHARESIDRLLRCVAYLQKHRISEVA